MPSEASTLVLLDTFNAYTSSSSHLPHTITLIIGFHPHPLPSTLPSTTAPPILQPALTEAAAKEAKYDWPGPLGRL